MKAMKKIYITKKFHYDKYIEMACIKNVFWFSLLFPSFSVKVKK